MPKKFTMKFKFEDVIYFWLIPNLQSFASVVAEYTVATACDERYDTYPEALMTPDQFYLCTPKIWP